MKTEFRQGRIKVIVSQDELDRLENIKKELKVALDEYLIYEREDIDLSISSHLTKEGKLNELSNLRHYTITQLDYNPEYKDVVYTNKNGFVEFDNGQLFLLFANAYDLLDDIDKGRRVLRNILRAELIKWMFENDYVNDNKVMFVINKKRNSLINHNVPFPFKENKYYSSFLTYLDRGHIIDLYTDYSYIFQRLKALNFIYEIKHKMFMKWLFENEFITKNEYNTLQIQIGFKSLSKSSTVHRENNFNNIFEL